MIKRFTIKNITVFDEADFEFCDGINVIIGENGTGKTHLLNTIYSILFSSFSFGSKLTTDYQHFNEKLSSDLIKTFNIENISDLINVKETSSNISIEFENSDKDFSFIFTETSKNSVTVCKKPTCYLVKTPIYFSTNQKITEEILSLLNSTSKTFKNKTTKKLLKELEEIIGGTITSSNNKIFIKTKDGRKINISLLSEGIQKFVIISKLIEIGLENRYLFLDMPENNLNPKLIKQIAKIIVELSKLGAQVFITTHSLFLMRELSILKMSQKNINIKYFSLVKKEDGTIRIENGQNYDDIETLVSLDEELNQNERYMKLQLGL